MARRKYAAETSVSVEKSEAELRAILRRYGADAFGQLEANGGVQIVFQINDRRIVFRLALPRRDDREFTHYRHGGSAYAERARTADAALEKWEQACRQKWRALLLCVKAKLESVDAGIETFDQAFLAHVMLPTGETVGERMRDELPAALEGRALPPLLPGPQT